MEDYKEIDTPIATGTKLDIDELGSSVDQTLYRGMIEPLLYLTASRPNIIFSVGLCARFQENPRESQLTDVKRILRYLEGTTDPCLWYPKSSNFNLVGYADADYVGFLVDRKRTSGTNLENRFVLVGSIAGVETIEFGGIGGKNKKEKEKESKGVRSAVRG
ncbi:secreted RxLR effector protein 161-like [Nicotiana tomentosiformis]|uniref:secreted RxLR effector protein 161-like n=1 Tax=Nicotiana tomentosiformis TaxID=4098 RepID=UPI00388CA7F3